MNRIASYFAGLIFVVFAIVQLNDADALVWFAIYLATALVCFLYPHRNLNIYLLLGLSIASMVGAIVLFPPSLEQWISAEEQAKSINMTLPGIEEARESMGLLICAITFLIYFVLTRSRIKHNKS